jgi:hypothetical protein
MLKHLHNKKIQKRIWIIMAILILPAFMFWGAGSAMRSSKEQGAGIIAGKEISLLEYQDALRATRNQALLIWGDEFFKLEKQMNLEAQAWDRLLLLEEAGKRKIKVSDGEVSDLIQSYPFFQKNSKFDMAIYERLLKFMFGTPVRIFEEQIRKNIAVHKLYQSITSGIAVSDEEIKNEYKKDNEEARVEYLNALPQDYAEGVAPLEDKEIEDYFKNNSLEFKKPESFNLEYAEILYPQDAKASETNDIDNKAKNIFPKLRNNKELSAAARQASLEAKQTSFFTLNEPIPGIGWSSEIIDMLTKLKPNQPAVPVHTAKGWYFLQLKEKKAPYVPGFGEVKEQVREKLIQLKSKQLAKEKIETAFTKIKDMDKEELKSVDFDKLAREFNLKPGQTEFFKRASYIPGIGISDKFFDIVSSLKVGELSIILETEQGFYIVRLKEWKGIDEAQYLKEKEKLSSRVLELKKQGVFAAFLEQLQKEARLQLNFTPQAEYPLSKK